jgi:aldehyde dehydrogenase (NAD+)
MSDITPYEFGDLAIGGQWRRGSARASIEVTNPWNKAVVARISGAGVGDVDSAYEAAATAQIGWSAALPGERSAVFQRLARIMEVRRDEIIDWLVREAGSTLAKAGIEWWAVHNSVVEAATLPFRVEGRILHGDYAGKENRIYREPVGVVGVISPWNWPLHLSGRSVLPAIALGNAAVIKPAADTPITGGLLIAKMMEEAGLPAGVLNVVAGSSSEIGDSFVAHDIPRVISFTGSTAVGRHVGRVALEAPRIKKTMLELGGNAPIIVTEDVDLDFAVRTVLAGKLFHQGQMCIAVNRIVVVDAIHDEFVAALVSAAEKLSFHDADDPATAYGPIINQRQLERILDLIAGARAQGARQLSGGAPSGLILPVHIFDNVTPDMTIAQTEIFGPVATIIRVADDVEAVRVANNTEYGLTSGVLCRDEGRAARLARQIRAGMTHINDIPAIDMPQMPFGGEKNSGLGRFGSKGMIDAFTREHWISIQHTKPQYPF